MRIRCSKAFCLLTKVGSIQNTIFRTGRTGSTCSHELSAAEDASPSWMSLFTRFSYGEIAFDEFEGIMNLKTCQEIEIETERLDDMLVIRKKKEQKLERAKKGSWSENWYVMSDFVPRSVRLIQWKCTCLPIGDIRDRRRERYNRVYILSRVRTNRVSLYMTSNRINGAIADDRCNLKTSHLSPNKLSHQLIRRTMLSLHSSWNCSSVVLPVFFFQLDLHHSRNSEYVRQACQHHSHHTERLVHEGLCQSAKRALCLCGKYACICFNLSSLHSTSQSTFAVGYRVLD